MSDPWQLQPAGPYIPGRNARPSSAPEQTGHFPAPVSTVDPDNWQDNRAYLQGLRFFNSGFYWEAHEMWEDVWMHCPPNSPQRHLLQGLIQFSNCCLKIRLERLSSAERLANMTNDCLREAAFGASGVLFGLDPAAIKVQLQEVQAWMQRPVRPDFIGPVLVLRN
jgi:hypothetical protein